VLGPALWLLEQADDGIALAQTGALNRALVREVADHWPTWWNADLFGPPNRQDDVRLLCELDDVMRGMRLVRRAGRRLMTTARGRELYADPAALLATVTSDLLAGDSFRAACAELAVASILDGAVARHSDALADQIQNALVAEGWHAAGAPPSACDVRWTVGAFLRPAEAIGLLTRRDSGSRSKPDLLILTEPGRAALVAGLRQRALAPPTGPF